MVDLFNHVRLNYLLQDAHIVVQNRLPSDYSVTEKSTVLKKYCYLETVSYSEL